MGSPVIAGLYSQPRRVAHNENNPALTPPFWRFFYMSKLYGKVTPPKDLQPAIDALTVKGRMYLRHLAQGQQPQPWMIAKVADWERENGLTV